MPRNRCDSTLEKAGGGLVRDFCFRPQTGNTPETRPFPFFYNQKRQPVRAGVSLSIFFGAEVESNDR